MKIEFVLVAVASALVIGNVQRDARADIPSDLPKLGAYDPEGGLGDQKGISIDHIFLNWAGFSAEGFRKAATDAAAQGREILVTVEPWTRAPNRTDGREALLPDIIAGRFDAEIDGICREIGAAAGPVMINWGHEMDETQGRFPWANQAPQTYQRAYRHFVDRCRPQASHARFGWTPKGEATLGAYYPGGDYVDFIGLTLFDSQAWNRDHADLRTLPDKFKSLHDQVVTFGKPIVLAEFGVSGDAAYRARALSCAQMNFRQFSDIEAIIYFNAREPWAWPAPYGQPDWRITDTDFFKCEPQEASAPGDTQ